MISVNLFLNVSNLQINNFIVLKIIKYETTEVAVKKS
jgi:hypothetical protein